MRVEFVLDVEASYSISPFASDAPMGMSISDGLELGAVFTVGLPLDVTADLDLSSGFYVKLNDGPGFSIAILGIDVSRIKSYGLISRYCRCGGGRLWIAGLLTVMGRRNGGQFEFFPVVVENAGFVSTATLLLDIHTRIYVGLSYIGISGGVHVSSFANVAESIANVTATPNDTTRELAAIQSYRLTLGAAAGATLAIDSHTLDPAASTISR